MEIDLRIPLGMMFSMMGAVLSAFGLATRTRPDLYVKSLGINGDMWWGVVLLVFGIIVLNLGRRGQGRCRGRGRAREQVFSGFHRGRGARSSTGRVRIQAACPRGRRARAPRR